MSEPTFEIKDAAELHKLKVTAAEWEARILDVVRGLFDPKALAITDWYMYDDMIFVSFTSPDGLCKFHTNKSFPVDYLFSKKLY